MIFIYEEDTFFKITLMAKDTLLIGVSVRGLFNKLCSNR